jgi:hypothetical protein
VDSTTIHWRAEIDALWLLFQLKSRGALRSWWRQARSPAGAVRGLASLAFVSLMLLPLVISWFKKDTLVENSELTSKLIKHGLPAALALFFYAVVCSPKKENFLHFTPPEIDFLFPAPFSRRGLLVYKLLSLASTGFVVSLFVTGFASMYLVNGNFWYSLARSFAGVYLTYLSIMLFVVLMGLIRDSLVVRLFNPVRKFVAAGAAALATIVALAARDKFNWEGWNSIGSPQDIEPIVMSIVESTAGQILVGPFRIYSNVILSESLIGFAIWTAACLLVNVALLWLIVRCDANYLEASVLASQKRVELAKSQNLETVFVSSRVGTLPMLPYWGGAGPVAWRQLQTFYRTWKVMIFYLFFLMIVVGAIVWTSRNEVNSVERFGMVTSILALITYGGTVAMPIGFHSDVNRMDVFKSLPASWLQIAGGQLLAAVFVLTLLQYIYVFIFMFTALDVWPLWLAVFSVAPLINLIMLSIANSIALVFPPRSEPGAVKQFENIGSVMIFMFIVTVVSMTLFCAVVVAGLLGYFVTGLQVVTFLLCWLMLGVFGVVGILVTGKAFQRYDVTKQVG